VQLSYAFDVERRIVSLGDRLIEQVPVTNVGRRAVGVESDRMSREHLHDSVKQRRRSRHGQESQVVRNAREIVAAAYLRMRQQSFRLRGERNSARGADVVNRNDAEEVAYQRELILRSIPHGKRKLAVDALETVDTL